MGRDGMSNNDGAPLSISALTSLCEQSKLFYATAVTSSPLTRGVACEALLVTSIGHNVPCASRRFASTSISQAADCAANVKCMGSDSPKQFDPRPSEHQYFKLPGSLLDE